MTTHDNHAAHPADGSGNRVAPGPSPIGPNARRFSMGVSRGNPSDRMGSAEPARASRTPRVPSKLGEAAKQVPAPGLRELEINGSFADPLLHERNPPGIIRGMESVSSHLRRALRECGEPMSAIAEQTGINKSVLSRFVSSGRAIRSDNLDQLCAHLGLSLTAKTTRKRKDR